MAGNSIGLLFRLTTFGESHGKLLGCIIDGVPPGLELSEKDFQKDLIRRRPGKNCYVSSRVELDKVKILSGVFEGRTTGTPIGLYVKNNNYNSKEYLNIKNVFRPGHADFCYQRKYGVRDYRGGGRASARETVMRVAAGSIAKKYLKEKIGIVIRAYLSQIGNISFKLKKWSVVETNPFFCPDLSKIEELKSLFSALKKEGNSVGAKITVIAENVPIGLGEPVFSKLDADIAHAMMSINAVKGVEIGDGFNVVHLKGSENIDEIRKSGFLSNHSGGILGGISNGQNIIVHVAFKPTSSINIASRTITVDNNEVKTKIIGRHDPCVAIRAIPITESMLAIILLDHFLRNRGQCG